MKGIILAGGLGKAFRPLSHTGPKQLVPIANKPVLHYVIEDLVAAGIKEIGIVVGYTEERIEAIKDAAGDGSRWGCRITYISQDAPRGLAHAVGICRQFTGEDDFVVYLGDNMIKGGIGAFVDRFRQSGCDAGLLLAEVAEPGKYGIALLDSGGQLLDVEEKPLNPRSNLAITGIYMFRPAIFEMIDSIKPSARGELEITDAIRRMVKSGKHKVMANRVTGWWDDTGTIEAVLNANATVLAGLEGANLGEVEAGAKIVGNVGIGRGTKVRHGSVIKGPSIIGEGCVIGPDTVIGSYTSIGNRVIVDGGEIESSIIYDDVRISYRGRIVDSIIGEFSEIAASRQSPRGDRFIIGSHSRIGRAG
ncbi:MAG: glucose-1-phosphate thymidylyltransferase [Chloroflexota bacterium]